MSAQTETTRLWKPCPFCGGDRLYISAVSNTGGNLKHVWCLECQAQGPNVNGPAENAGNAWNARASLAKADTQTEKQ